MALTDQDKDTVNGFVLMALFTPDAQNGCDEESFAESDNDNGDASEWNLAVAYGDTVDMNHYYFRPDFAG